MRMTATYVTWIHSSGYNITQQNHSTTCTVSYVIVSKISSEHFDPDQAYNTITHNMADNRLRVGIIGAGEVAQVIHLPALAMLSHLYITTAVCDISKKVESP
jgi:hypothetical protein